MDYKDFLEYIKKGVAGFVGMQAAVSINRVMKNNSVYLDGLCIMEQGKNISPTIYVNHYYEEYKEGKKLQDIVTSIIDIFEKARVSGNMDVDFFTEFDRVKGKIVYRLINREQNKELLEQIPHIDYLDLAIVFYCMITNDCIGNATITIYNRHMEMWETDVDVLYELAKINTPKLLQGEIKSMDAIMKELIVEDLRSRKAQACGAVSCHMEDGMDYEVDEEEWISGIAEQMIYDMKDGKKEDRMYVLSNHTKMNGAICVLYDGILDSFADKIRNDIFILPSSVHEVILVPVEESMTSDTLRAMVKEVNETQVEVEEVLSNSVYRYEWDTKKIARL